MHSSLALAVALVGSVSAHMVIDTPPPFQVGDKKVQVNPLGGPEFPFPCQLKQGEAPDEIDGTEVTAGDSTLVKFTGSAAHGGGSCQFSVTYDWPPPADPSKWKVIHSIIGGCPTAFNDNVQGNGQDEDGRAQGVQCGNSESEGNCVRQFDIPIPKELKNGRATFAWSWFNKIGNREMYMNCSPIKVTGGSEDSSFLDSLPEMFVANIEGACKTADGSHVIGFPNPGQSVVQYQEISPSGQGACPAAGKGGDSNGGFKPPTKPDTPSTPSQPAEFHPVPEQPKPEVPQPQPSQPAAFHPVPEKPQNEAPKQTTLATQPAAAPTPAPPSYAPVSPDAVPCTNEGGVVCMGTDHFGLCNHGFAVPQAVAFGTACANGKVLRRAEAHHRHARRHLAHHAKHL